LANIGRQVKKSYTCRFDRFAPVQFDVLSASQKSQWRSAAYCASIRVDRSGCPWINQAGVLVVAA
jgi:hypothetical protein